MLTHMNSRRRFLQQSSALVGGTIALSALHANAFEMLRTAPSDQINVGVIGINGMGWSDLQAALTVPGVNLAAICDVDKNVIDRRLAEVQKNTKIDASKVKVYSDYRQLLDQKDIDVVIIGTPDHWHALQMIHACEAGKHVYVEKPVGNSIAECNAMVAAKNYYRS